MTKEEVRKALVEIKRGIPNPMEQRIRECTDRLPDTYRELIAEYYFGNAEIHAYALEKSYSVRGIKWKLDCAVTALEIELRH